MNSNRESAKIIGILFIISTATFILGSQLIGGVLSAPDYLTTVYPNNSQIIAGVLLELVNNAAVIGIAVMFFPILKQFSERVALLYFGSRVIEAVLLICSLISLIALIALSKNYGIAGNDDASYFQSLGSVIRSSRYAAFQMAMVSLSLGSLLFCWLLYRTKLVPRAIATLGLVGYFILLAKIVLELFEIEAGGTLFIPSAVFELVLPIWLIVKGFNTSANHMNSSSGEKKG